MLGSKRALCHLSYFGRQSITASLLLCLSLTLVVPLIHVTASSSLPKYIDEYVVPTPNSAPLAITADRNGIIWFTESNVTKLGRFDPQTNTFKEYSVPGVGDMWGVTVDLSGYVWITQYSGRGSVNPGGAIVPGGQGRLLRFNPQDGNFNVVDIPTVGSFPFRVVTDNQGRVWFTELLGNKIGTYDPVSGRLEEYDVPSPFAGPADLTFDRHGRLWFTEAYNESVAEFQPATNSFVEYHLSTSDPSRFISSPVGIVVDEKDHVWFADHGGNWIIEFNPTSQSLVQYPTAIPTGYAGAIAIPNGLLIDGRGRVWFSEHWGNRIGYYDPQTQTMIEFPIPTGPISTALWIALAPNGDIWFTEWDTNRIGVLHTALPVPFSLTPSNNHIRIEAGGGTSVSLLAKTTQEIDGNGTLRYSWSSYNPDEVQVLFSPQLYPSFAMNATRSEAQVKISTKVSPGNYTLSIGLDAGVVLISRMVRVEVTVAAPAPILSTGASVFLLVGILAVALGLILFRKRLSSAPKSRSHRHASEGSGELTLNPQSPSFG